MQQDGVICDFSGCASWIILSPIEQCIKSKIEKLGTPLKQWDVNIYRGVLTGYNDAFIISTERRNEILNKCQTDEERHRTAELIRPILRGRDIKRYNYDWDNLYLIYIPWHFPYHLDNSITGASEIAEEAFSKQYPSVYQHMNQYKEPLSNRNKAETGIRYEWYALQRWGAKYWEDFSKPKIVWGNLNLTAGYALVEANCFINAPSSMIVPANKYLLAMLNSKLSDFYIRQLGVTRNGGYFEYKPMFVEKLPVPKLAFNDINLITIEHLVENSDYAKIDQVIYNLFKLTKEEINYIEFSTALV